MTRALSVAAVIAVGYLVGGADGAIVGLLAGLVAIAAPIVIKTAAGLGPAVLAVMSLTEASLSEPIPEFVRLRPNSHLLGTYMIIVWVAAAVAIWGQATAEEIRQREEASTRLPSDAGETS